MSKILYERFYKNDEHKFSEREFRTRIAVSLFCIVACMAAMLSSAYAWFLVGISSEQNVISSANYLIEVEAENTGMSKEKGCYTYICGVAAEDEHFFAITATGTAQNGYCEINIKEKIVDADGNVTYQNGDTYKTGAIAQGNTLNVCVRAAQNCRIEFVPVWCAAETATIFSLRRPQTFYIDHSTTPYIEYLVIEGVTLEALAEYYGVSVEDICIYNGISELEIGETIKIPGIEADSIEPYMPPQAGVATPSNATPSDAMQQTGEEQATEGASAIESSAAAESAPAVESSAATESTPAAESSAVTESTSAAESSAAIESTSAAESSTATESTSEVESSTVTESTSATETTITTESVPATEAENLPESTSATQSESVIFTAPDPTSSDAASSGEEPADPSIPPEMPTEDIEAMSETEATELGTETEATSEPS